MTPSAITARKPQLQDDQKFALMKFRRSVADVLKPEHDDYFLVRWLRARSWNPIAAEKMLRDSLKWRERWNADNPEKIVVPEVCQKLCPRGLVGFDKEGSPVGVVSYGGLDIWGLLHAARKIDLMRMTVKTIEEYLIIANQQSLKPGNTNNAKQLIVIFDMHNFALKPFLWRPATEMVIALTKMYSDNYPEILKYAYVINAPKVFAIGFNIIKKLLDAYTLSKIMIFKADQKKWLPHILETVDRSQIPQHFGGDLVDENGDPKCSKLINWGGKVPKELYRKNITECDEDDTFIEAVIKKGSKFKLDFNTEEKEGILRWEFRTIEHDIRFGIKCLNLKTEEKTEAVPFNRVAAHEVDETGFLECQSNCKYTFVFDNSYSYMRNKKVKYNIALVESLNEIENAIEEDLVE